MNGIWICLCISIAVSGFLAGAFLNEFLISDIEPVELKEIVPTVEVKITDAKSDAESAEAIVLAEQIKTANKIKTTAHLWDLHQELVEHEKKLNDFYDRCIAYSTHCQSYESRYAKYEAAMQEWRALVIQELSR